MVKFTQLAFICSLFFAYLEAAPTDSKFKQYVQAQLGRRDCSFPPPFLFAKLDKTDVSFPYQSCIDGTQGEFTRVLCDKIRTLTGEVCSLNETMRVSELGLISAGLTDINLQVTAEFLKQKVSPMCQSPEFQALDKKKQCDTECSSKGSFFICDLYYYMDKAEKAKFKGIKDFKKLDLYISKVRRHAYPPLGTIMESQAAFHPCLDQSKSDDETKELCNAVLSVAAVISDQSLPELDEFKFIQSTAADAIPCGQFPTIPSLQSETFGKLTDKTKCTSLCAEPKKKLCNALSAGMKAITDFANKTGSTNNVVTGTDGVNVVSKPEGTAPASGSAVPNTAGTGPDDKKVAAGTAPANGSVVPIITGTGPDGKIVTPKTSGTASASESVAPKTAGSGPDGKIVTPNTSGTAPASGSVAPKTAGTGPDGKIVTPNTAGTASASGSVVPITAGTGPDGKIVAPNAAGTASASGSVVSNTLGTGPDGKIVTPNTAGTASASGSVAPKTAGTGPDGKIVAPNTSGTAPASESVAPNTAGTGPDGKIVTPNTSGTAPASGSVVPITAGTGTVGGNVALNTAAVPLGSACTTEGGSRCVENAECKKTGFDDKSTCQCREGYKSSADAGCQKLASTSLAVPLGSACTTEGGSRCAENAECKKTGFDDKSTCQCREGYKSSADAGCQKLASTSLAVSLGSACTTEGGSRCVENAECKKTGFDDKSTCQCREGYKSSADAGCQKLASTSLAVPLGSACTTEGGSRCIENAECKKTGFDDKSTCQCREGYKSSADAGCQKLASTSLAVPLGSACTTEGGSRCIENAECKKTGFDDKSTCQCREGYKSSADAGCQKLASTSLGTFTYTYMETTTHKPLDDNFGGFSYDDDYDKKVANNLEVSDKKKPVETKSDDTMRPLKKYGGEEESSGIGFMSYFLVITVLVVAGYLVFHNKQKIIALVVEGKGAGRNGNGRRPNSKEYRQLKTEDVMPSLEKTAASKDYVF